MLIYFWDILRVECNPNLFGYAHLPRMEMDWN